jgi:uncharacterized lipoprotein YmbA
VKKRTALCLTLLLALCACTSGPPIRTFVLAPALQAVGPSPMPTSSPGRIVIRRVLVPDYLDTTDIVVREGNNEVKASHTGKWGERLSQGLTHALAADLATRLPSNILVLDSSNTEDRQLLINVNGLDLWQDGRCVISATWTIVDHQGPRSFVGGNGTFASSPSDSTSGPGDTRLVDAIARTVAKLADAITLNIQQTSQPSTHRVD